jgi:hypothetical protein
MLRKSFTFFALGLAALASTQADAAIVTGVITQTETAEGAGPAQYLGFTFKINEVMTVSSLGVYVSSTNTTVVPGQVVYLYDVTQSTLLASTPVTGTLFKGQYDYASIANTYLTSLTDTYEIVSYFTAAATQQYGLAPLTYSSDLNSAQSGYNSAASAPPTGAPSLTAYNGIMSTNFQYTAGIVPEPASIGMMGLGLVGAFLVRRKMAKRSA